MIKLAIGTLNGGGTATLERLYESFVKHMYPQLVSNCELWKWHILVQGDKGANKFFLDKIVNQLKEVNIINVNNNIGVVKGTNTLFDNFKKESLDAFMILDDDIEIYTNAFLSKMIHAIFQLKKKTCSTHICYFGKERNEYAKRLNEVIDIGDHGSGFTLYHGDILNTCGYYDENLIQYGSDTEFNNRIKLNYGQKSLSLLGGVHALHYNQTGTKNCYSNEEWQKIYKHDNEYLKNKDYTIADCYVQRKSNNTEQIKN